MWFKYGLKAQKLQKQHALKGQKGASEKVIAMMNNKIRFISYIKNSSFASELHTP